MSRPLLQTKLFIPPRRANLVVRSRLTERLEAAVQQHHALSLVSAKAGAGKTTLVSEWLHQQERPVVWLSLKVSQNSASTSPVLRSTR